MNRTGWIIVGVLVALVVIFAMVNTSRRDRYEPARDIEQAGET